MSHALTAEGPPRRWVVTPEGIRLPFEVASVGDRVTAFALDLALLFGILFVLWLGGLAVFGESPAAMSFVVLAHFLIVNFYFIFFELRGTGMTWGKRRYGLRVIARDGGPLTAEAVFARNMLRELEFFLPLAALLAPGAIMADVPGGWQLLGILWILLFAMMPLLGKDHLRCGDLAAGTLVIKVPHLELLADLTQTTRMTRGEVQRRRAARRPDTRPKYQFTPEQLDMYGIHELQVLEDLLRRWGERRVEVHVLDLVCDKIQRKIGWSGGEVSRLPFLECFYKAQRAHLEQRMLFGQRRERKRRGRRGV